MTTPDAFGTPLSRRSFLTAAAVGLAGLSLTACGTRSRAPTASGVDPQALATAEATRPHSGRTVTGALTAQPTQIDLGGPVVRTLAYGDTVPAPTIRAGVGDELAITVTNSMTTPPPCTGTASHCATTWTAPNRPARTSPPATRSPTDSRYPARAPTGPTRTWACKPTTGSTSR
ncbi:hypothetical protein GCM10023094_48550 [Rhodococcus olei]|uniref:Multicopper oxidase n=1 Tax=Rhodococcus olei TaxID=2161675 RepID=A0ABP8PN38_9NOCA